MADALSGRIPSTSHMKVRACTIKEEEVNIYLDSTTDALLLKSMYTLDD